MNRFFFSVHINKITVVERDKTADKHLLVTTNELNISDKGFGIRRRTRFHLTFFPGLFSKQGQSRQYNRLTR